MADTQNFHDSEERREQEANKAASEKMERNNEQQDDIRKRDQNNLTQSEDPDADASSLLNNTEKGRSTDAVSDEFKNNRRLKENQDEDFGSN